MNNNNLKNFENHVNILGWLFIGANILILLIMGFVMAILMGAGMLSGEAEAMGVMVLIGLIVGFTMLIFAVPGILAGWGLLKGKNWGRILALVIGILNIFSFPFGTALGIYAIWVLLMQDESQRYFTTPKMA